MLRKKSNVVAIYFNGELYHVQTMLEDVNKDLLAPQIGTRKITLYESGYYADREGTELANFCSIFAPEQVQNYLHIPSFLYSTGVVQMLGSSDNYPKYPYNHFFVQETESKKKWFMVDDLDSTIDSYSDGQSDPYQTYITEGDSQRYFTALVSDPVYRSQYSSALRELLPLFHPDKLQPLVVAKYAQVRATLHASPQLPLGPDWYDYVYLSELLAWIEARYAYLTKLLAQDHETTNGIPTAVIAPLVPTLEATEMEGAQVTLNGANSTDPDNDPLTFLWLVDGQEMGQSAIIESKLGIGSYLIRLTGNDGRGGSATTTANIEITPPPPATEVTIKAVSPPFIRRGTGVVLEITGTGFSPYSEVSFSDSSVRVQTYDLRGEKIILVYLIADNFGTYDLKVINPDGKTAVLSDALTVGFGY